MTFNTKFMKKTRLIYRKLTVKGKLNTFSEKLFDTYASFKEHIYVKEYSLHAFFIQMYPFLNKTVNSCCEQLHGYDFTGFYLSYAFCAIFGHFHAIFTQ